jgi:hypothetical protein
MSQNTKERIMLELGRPKVALFVEKRSRRWIVRDPDGNYWMLPGGENPWDQRQPFQPTEQTELEPVPGHYRYMLGLPF